MSGNAFNDWTTCRDSGLRRKTTLALMRDAVAALFVAGNRSAIAGCNKVGRKCDKN